MVQAHGTVLTNGEIQINGQPYILAREESLQKLGLSARRWKEDRIPQSTRIEARPDVAPGAIKGEYIITWNDWSKGLAGLHDPYPGTIHKAYNIDPTQPGALRQIGALQTYTETTTPTGGDAVWIGRHGGITFAIMGRLSTVANNLSPGDALTLDKDFGAGQAATDAVLYEGSMYVCFGDVALGSKTDAKNYKLWKRSTAINAGDQIGSISFTGAGLNDMTLGSSAQYEGASDLTVTVEVLNDVPSPETYRWSTDGGATWVESGINMHTAERELVPADRISHGIYIKFGATTGHTTGERWAFTCTATPWNQDDHIGTIAYTAGAGIDDMILGQAANFRADTGPNITVKIVTAAATDQFQWDSGSGFSASIDCSLSDIELKPGNVSQGIYIRFRNITGHDAAAPADTWTFSCTPVPHAHHFAVVRNRLWRGFNYDSADTAARAEVSNIGPGVNPETDSAWSADLVVGDQNVPITDLNAVGERLAVSKETGLYFGDENAIFPNALPQIESSIHPDNGRNTLVRGGDVLYPYRSGFLEYGYGQSKEIGLERALLDADAADTAAQGQPAGTRITASVMQGDNIWVATEPSYLPRAMPDKVYFWDKSASGGAGAFAADETSKVVDSSYIATSALTAARSMQGTTNTDYIYVGYIGIFYGIVMELLKVNANDSNTTLEYSKGSGTWGAMPKSGSPLTVPIIGTETVNLGLNRAFSKSGVIAWGDLPSDWATDTVNSTALKYWIRISVSADQEATTPDIAEIRVVTSQPVSYVFRGRPRGPFDRPEHSIVWEPICAVTGVAPSITAMSMASHKSMPYRRGESLMMATRNKIIIHERNVAHWDQCIDEQVSGSQAFFSKHHGGMPEVNKQWMRVTLKGATIDANHVVTVYYRTDETVAWTQLATGFTSNVLTVAFPSTVTGKTLQLKLLFNAVAGTKPAAPVNTEVNEVEVAFRPLWTYKNQYTALLELADGQSTSAGGYLPDASVQLTNLESAHGVGTVAAIDPTGRSYSVTVDDLSVVEHIQNALDYPALLAQCVMTEI